MQSPRKPYLVFLGDVCLRSDAKTGFGLRDLFRDVVIGQFALAGAQATVDLPNLTPAEGSAACAKCIV